MDSFENIEVVLPYRAHLKNLHMLQKSYSKEKCSQYCFKFHCFSKILKAFFLITKRIWLKLKKDPKVNLQKISYPTNSPKYIYVQTLSIPKHLGFKTTYGTIRDLEHHINLLTKL